MTDAASLDLVEKKVLSPFKAELMAVVLEQLKRQFRYKEVDVTEDQAKSTAALSLELGSADF